MSTETYRDHVEQQEKHIKNHIGDEIRKVKEREERETHGFHDVIGDEIAHEEKAERRQQDETDGDVDPCIAALPNALRGANQERLLGVIATVYGIAHR